MKAMVVLSSGERKVLYGAAISYEGRYIKGITGAGALAVIPFEAIQQIIVRNAEE